MSDVRSTIHSSEGDLSDEGELKTYEVFICTKRGRRHAHAGALEAPDDEMALQFAREHYGQDEPCVSMWVVARDAISEADQKDTVIWRSTDQTYRLARGYSREVRQKWEKFRAAASVDKYQSEDLKETF